MWPEHQYGSSTLWRHFLYQVWQLSIKGVERYWVDYIFSQTSSLTLTFGHVIWKLFRVIYLLGASIIPSLQLSGKVVKRFWANFFFKDSHFDLNLWPCDLKINKGHLLSSGIHCRNFLAKGPGQKILSGHHLYKDQQFNLDLWPCDLKINYYREHLPSRGIHYTKLENFMYRADITYTKTSNLIFTFTWKSIGNINSLGASNIRSLRTLKQRGQKILSGHRLVYRPTDRPFFINIDWMSVRTTVNHGWNIKAFISNWVILSRNVFYAFWSYLKFVW